MNDFFTRMAERSREEAAIVEPRLPALFGPVEYIVPTENFELETVRSLTTHPNGKNGENTENSPVVDDRESSEVQVSSVKQPLFTDARQSSGLVINATILPPARETEYENNHSDSQPVKTILSAEKKLHKKNAQPTVITEMENSQPTPVTELQSPLIPDYKSPRLSLQEHMVEVPAAIEQNLQHKPAVHINIGRIEVRAHTSSPPTPLKPLRSKPRKKLSTLNDYLKRSGGIS